jgi:sugar phosphate isomerase/epimerase
MIRLGGHGLPVGHEDFEAFARAHTAYGYGAAYVPVALKLENAAAFERAFAAEDVMLAEVGIWRNLTTPNEAKRRANREYAVNCLALADAVGAKCAVSYVGSFSDTDYGPDPANLGADAFDACVEATRYLLDTVKPRRAKFALEMMQYSLPDSVDSYVDLIKAVDRPMFGAHFDPVNLVMTPRVYWNNAALIRECFAKLGEHVVSCHAKDIILHHQAALHLDEIIIGRGVIDYRTYLTELAKLSHDVPLMLEHLKGDEYRVARDAVFAAGDASGITFAKRPRSSGNG